MPVTVCITCDIDSDYDSESYLKDYLKTINSEGIKATFFVNNEIINKNPKQAEILKITKHEIAAHGDIHTPFYGSYAELSRRLKENKDLLEKFYKTKVVGFRAPRLKYSKSLYKALKDNRFSYSSNKHRREVISYAPILGFTYQLKNFKILKPILRFLAKLVYKKEPKPYIKEGILEIPVTTPCDSFMIELKQGPHIKKENASKIAETWIDMLGDMKNYKDAVLVILTHPQFIGNGYLGALSKFIRYAKENNAEFKTLKEVANSFQF